MAAEQQTMNFYMNVGNRPQEMLGRGLHLEIAQIEEQHVTHYESLADPEASWFERMLLHEYNECWLYHSLMQDEPDKQVRDLWKLHRDMKVEHVKIAAKLLEKYEDRDAEGLLPTQMPDPLRLSPTSNTCRRSWRSKSTTMPRGRSSFRRRRCRQCAVSSLPRVGERRRLAQRKRNRKTCRREGRGVSPGTSGPTPGEAFPRMTWKSLYVH